MYILHIISMYIVHYTSVRCIIYIHITYDRPRTRRCECHPGTNFWHPPFEVTQFWHPRSGFGARFFKGQKRLYWPRGGGKVCNKSCWKWFKLLFYFILMNFFCLVFQKRKQAPKPLLGCQNWVTSTAGAKKTNSRVTLARSWTGVVCHIYTDVVGYVYTWM